MGSKLNLNDIPALSSGMRRVTRSGLSSATVDAIQPPIDTPPRATGPKWLASRNETTYFCLLRDRIGAVGRFRGLSIAKEVHRVHVIRAAHQIRCKRGPIVLCLGAEPVDEHDGPPRAAFDVMDVITSDHHRAAVNSGA